MKKSNLTSYEIKVLYEGGVSAPRIGEIAGITESAIRGHLQRLKVPMRKPSDYPPHVAAAHAARRGMIDPYEVRERRARTREALALNGELVTSKYEDELAAKLDELGVTYTRQKAIGAYNADFVIGNKVIELNGGGHNPRVRANRPARTAWIEREGYEVHEFDPPKNHRWLAAVLREIA